MFTAGTQHICGHHFHHVTSLFATFGELRSIDPALAGGAQIRAGGLKSEQGAEPPPPNPPLTLTTGMRISRGFAGEGA